MTSSPSHVVVLGGGAAGFFAALACAEDRPDLRVTLLERTGHLLSKVKISGGGRCNVTHACFDPARLVGFYPRGGDALRGPLSRFQPEDTVAWFAARGVELKTEPDGRMFPITNQSQTILDCLTSEASKLGITTTCNAMVKSVERKTDGRFELLMESGQVRPADRVILATGSNPLGWEWARALGHTVEPPVPSLFTFTIKDPRLHDLAGLSVPMADVRLEGSDLSQTGPLLITHWGLSGPAVLKLSAWGARWLHDRQYQATLIVKWLSGWRDDAVEAALGDLRLKNPKKVVVSTPLPGFPQRLWSRLVLASGIPIETRWTETSNPKLRQLSRELCECRFTVTGRSPFKDEFVTCGGVRRDEVHFKTMESKRCPGLYFAGEVLDIDGVTGGFNFQNAWTTGWLAGKSSAATLS